LVKRLFRVSKILFQKRDAMPYALFSGLIIGSFLNVVIFRIPKEESIISPPSSCGTCGTRLGAIDLVPILSYVILRGRCRHCGAKISARYPMVELLTGFLFVLLFWRYGLSVEFAKYATLSCILVCVAFIDMDHRIIPDRLNLFGLAAAIIFLFISSDLTPLDAFYGFLAGGGFLFLLAVLSRGAMGGGDIKLFAVIGIFLGLYKTATAMFLTFILAGVVGILLIAFRIRTRKDYMPFGPFISISAFIIIMWYNELIAAYINLMS